MARPSPGWIRDHGYGTAFDRLEAKTIVVGDHWDFDAPLKRSGKPRQIRCYVDGVGWVEAVQRLAWIAACGEIPEGMCVVRTCDFAGCIRPTHLTLATRAEAGSVGTIVAGNPPLDITGERYGRLVAIRRVESRRLPCGQLVSWWLFRCDCGTEKGIAMNNVRAGKQVSCGCLIRTKGVHSTERHRLCQDAQRTGAD